MKLVAYGVFLVIGLAIFWPAVLAATILLGFLLYTVTPGPPQGYQGKEAVND